MTSRRVSLRMAQKSATAEVKDEPAAAVTEQVAEPVEPVAQKTEEPEPKRTKLENADDLYAEEPEMLTDSEDEEEEKPSVAPPKKSPAKKQATAKATPTKATPTRAASTRAASKKVAAENTSEQEEKTPVKSEQDAPPTSSPTSPPKSPEPVRWRLEDAGMNSDDCSSGSESEAEEPEQEEEPAQQRMREFVEEPLEPNYRPYVFHPRETPPQFVFSVGHIAARLLAELRGRQSLSKRKHREVFCAACLDFKLKSGECSRKHDVNNDDRFHEFWMREYPHDEPITKQLMIADLEKIISVWY